MRGQGLADSNNHDVVELPLSYKPHGLVITAQRASRVALDLGLEEPSLDGAGVRVGEIP